MKSVQLEVFKVIKTKIDEILAEHQEDPLDSWWTNDDESGILSIREVLDQIEYLIHHDLYDLDEFVEDFENAVRIDQSREEEYQTFNPDNGMTYSTALDASNAAEKMVLKLADKGLRGYSFPDYQPLYYAKRKVEEVISNTLKKGEEYLLRQIKKLQIKAEK